jgi:raffinose/stachyose/melibiose transport system permease protein
MRLTKENLLTVTLLLLPGLLVYGLLVLFPMVDSLVLSLYKWPTLDAMVYTGFDNYKGVFADPIFWKSVKNTLIFMTMTTVLEIIFGFILGYFVYLQLKGHRFFKTVFFIPAVLASVAVGYIWNYIYSPAFGLLKPFMEAVGLGRYYIPPLAAPSTALIFTILAYIWNNIGVPIMMFNSAFMNIPEELLEVASLEGAVGWKRIYYMIIPLSWDVVKVIIILQVIGGLRAFDLIYVMTGGGPNHATEVLTMHLFVDSFQNMNIGYGSVISTVIFALALGMTLMLRKMMQREAIV